MGIAFSWLGVRFHKAQNNKKKAECVRSNLNDPTFQIGDQLSIGSPATTPSHADWLGTDKERTQKGLNGGLRLENEWLKNPAKREAAAAVHACSYRMFCRGWNSSDGGQPQKKKRRKNLSTRKGCHLEAQQRCGKVSAYTFYVGLVAVDETIISGGSRHWRIRRLEALSGSSEILVLASSSDERESGHNHWRNQRCGEGSMQTPDQKWLQGESLKRLLSVCLFSPPNFRWRLRSISGCYRGKRHGLGSGSCEGAAGLSPTQCKTFSPLFCSLPTSKKMHVSFLLTFSNSTRRLSRNAYTAIWVRYVPFDMAPETLVPVQLLYILNPGTATTQCMTVILCWQLASVAKFAKDCLDKKLPVNVLVLNAGMMPTSNQLTPTYTVWTPKRNMKISQAKQYCSCFGLGHSQTYQSILMTRLKYHLQNSQHATVQSPGVHLSGFCARAKATHARTRTHARMCTHAHLKRILSACMCMCLFVNMCMNIRRIYVQVCVHVCVCVFVWHGYVQHVHTRTHMCMHVVCTTSGRISASPCMHTTRRFSPCNAFNIISQKIAQYITHVCSCRPTALRWHSRQTTCRIFSWRNYCCLSCGWVIQRLLLPHSFKQRDSFQRCTEPSHTSCIHTYQGWNPFFVISISIVPSQNLAYLSTFRELFSTFFHYMHKAMFQCVLYFFYNVQCVEHAVQAGATAWSLGNTLSCNSSWCAHPENIAHILAGICARTCRFSFIIVAFAQKSTHGG